MEVTGRKDVQNGGRSILKMTTAFGLSSSLSKVKIYFFLLFTSNLSYFNSFELPHTSPSLPFSFKPWFFQPRSQGLSSRLWFVPRAFSLAWGIKPEKRPWERGCTPHYCLISYREGLGTSL